METLYNINLIHLRTKAHWLWSFMVANIDKNIQIFVRKSVCLFGQFSVKSACWDVLIIMVASNVISGSSAKFLSEFDLAPLQHSSCSVCQAFFHVPQQPRPDAFNSWWCQAQGGRRRRRVEGGAQGCLPIEPWKHGTQSMLDDRHTAKWQNTVCRGNRNSTSLTSLTRIALPRSRTDLKSQ